MDSIDLGFGLLFVALLATAFVLTAQEAIAGRDRLLNGAGAAGLVLGVAMLTWNQVIGWLMLMSAVAALLIAAIRHVRQAWGRVVATWRQRPM